MPEQLVAQLPAIVVLVPLAAAPVVFLVGVAGARTIVLTAAVLEVVAAFALGVSIASGGPVRYTIGGWGAPLGIDLVVDGLSAVMIMLTAVVGLGVTVYAVAYFEGASRYRHFWPLWLFLWASLIALFSSGDAFNLYVCLELVSMAAVALVALSGRAEALVAAMRYMVAAILGSILYLLGVAMLYGAYGVLDLGTLSAVARPDVAAQAGIALAVVGLVLKTALFPGHFWLPPAHANAPSPVSAVLSALVVKGSFYIIVRLVLFVVGPAFVGGLPLVLGVLGAAAIVWGSVQAWRQERLKMLVAYSTVAQIGYLFVMFPLIAAAGAAAGGAGAHAGSAVSQAFSGGVMHAVSHGLAKSAMFLAAGAVLARFGHDRIPAMRGFARRAPVVVMAFGVAGVSMLGLPPSGGFVAKWQLISSALATGQWWWAAIVVLGGLLAAGYVFRVLGPALTIGPDAGQAGDTEEAATAAGESPSAATRTLEWVALALAVASFASGVAAQPVLELIEPSAAAIAALAMGVTP